MSSDVSFFPTEYGHVPMEPNPIQRNRSFGNVEDSAYTGGQTGIGNIDSGGLFTDSEEEPPLLEELGINFSHIRQKTFAVLHPLNRSLPPDLVDDSDLAGAMVFALGLGFALLLTGKWTFDYIYGFGAIGCLAMYFMVNAMCPEHAPGVNVYQTVSILGYCLLPMVLLAFTTIALPSKSSIGMVLAVLTVLWCTNSATVMFTSPHMNDQKVLVAYPLFLFYAIFALLTIF